MQYHFVFGSYVPSYLLIKIRTVDPIDNIRDLIDADKAIFFHEYTHFLQNITGGFGHSHIWHTYDQLRQVVSEEQKNLSKIIKIPLSNEVMDQQRLFIRVMRTINGNKYVPEGIDDATASIESLKLVKDKNFDTLYPHAGMRFLNLHLKDENGNEGDYLFGDTAVSETMAYLIETKYFGESVFNNYPYRACRKLGERLQTDLLENDEWLFALCDVSLISNYPGRAFHQILLDMSQTGFVPNVAEDIYDYGLRLMYEKLKWRVWEDFEENKNGAIHVLNELTDYPIFKETVEWFKYILDFGYSERVAVPSMLLQIYREPDCFKGLWELAMARFGTPQIQNSVGERYFSAPLELKDKEEKIEPLFLLSLQQLNNTLIFGNSHCGLYKCCDKSPNVTVDDRCKNSPWERAKDDNICAYGTLWRLYGFTKKNVEVIV